MIPLTVRSADAKNPVTDQTATWVVGARGLLGGAVMRELALMDRHPTAVTVPWTDTNAANARLVKLAAEITGSGLPWRVMWCAGAAVIGASNSQLEAEQYSLGVFLDALRATSSPDVPGALFLASSAGGVYAGSSAPPFTEITEPHPISPYGDGKLACESLAREFSELTGKPVLIGRIANLYGPGQNLSKAQGLISQLCWTHFSRQPLSIYVSLDTARDYIFATDAAKLAIAALDRAAMSPAHSVVVKLIASQSATTVAALLGELRSITRRRPRITLGTSSLSKFQIKDLRFRSVVWTDLDSLVTTGLPSGVFATLEGLGTAQRLPTRIA